MHYVLSLSLLHTQVKTLSMFEKMQGPNMQLAI